MCFGGTVDGYNVEVGGPKVDMKDSNGPTVGGVHGEVCSSCNARALDNELTTDRSGVDTPTSGSRVMGGRSEVGGAASTENRFAEGAVKRDVAVFPDTGIREA